MHRIERDGFGRGERLTPTITFTGTPLIPYIIADPRGSEWDLEYRRLRREAEGYDRTRRGLNRFAGLRNALGGAIIWTGERIAGAKPSEPVGGPVSDLHGAH